MGILSQLLRPEQRVGLANNPPPWLIHALNLSTTATDTATGINITAETALQLPAVLAAVRVLSESVASLPFLVYERQERGKRRATEHYLYSILHNAPNPEMTAFEFWELAMQHLPVWGDFFANVVRDGGGRVRQLWPLRPDRMEEIKRADDKRLRYGYRMPDGQLRWLWPNEILHIRGMGSDGIRGRSLIGLARQSVSLGLAAEEFGARFFGNGARPGMVLEHPGHLSDDAHERLRKSWETRHQGLSNAQRVAILEEGMRIEQIGIPPEDAQFLETRRFQVDEIARVFRIPPHMLGELERATFSNIEHQGIEFVVYSLRPWLVRIEQRIWLDLLTPTERKRYFAEFLVDALLRGDFVARNQGYATARQWGWMSANDVRELENMNPVAGGDSYLVPLNMLESGSGMRAGAEER